MQQQNNDHTVKDAKVWVSCQALAAMLGVHQQTIRRMAHEGVIPGLKVGSYFRFDPEAVEAALAVRTR